MAKVKSVAQELSEDPELIECLWLVKNGVPYDVSFTMSQEQRFAYAVILAKFEGSDWDWRSNKWKPRKD